MEAPIFIIGRQHSGNTMLASMLDRHPNVLGLKNEGAFFESRTHLEALSPGVRTDRLIELLLEEVGGVDVSSEKLKRKIQNISERESVSAEMLYRRGMNWVAEQCGVSRWARKATSYVFYIEDILQVFPGARLIFLVRNPLDLAASLKRRGEWRRILRMVWGWNQGTAAAMKWAETGHEHVLVVRYEDLVQTPRETMMNVCEFVGLSFRDELLHISHVNRSETPYNQKSEQTGINASRVHYYADVLSAEEEAVVRICSNPDIVSQCYADLPPARKYRMGPWIWTLLRSVGASAVTLAADHAGSFVREPRRVLDRIRHRIG